ncbi:MAG: hypothetical protein ABIB71_05655 [Candidatus Woesearchaeota archaeon]
MTMIKHYYPTFPKILLYAAFTMVVPALFSVCTENGCRYNLTFFPGIVLLRNSAEGTLTIYSIVLWFGLSYILACLAAFGMRKLATRKKGF